MSDSIVEGEASFWDLREAIKSRMRQGLIDGPAEAAGGYGPGAHVTPLNERLIQAIWANQLLRPEGLKLADGRPVRVLDPGRWNGAAGPDFREARLMLGVDEVRGDVEIHLNASLWRAHRHDADLDYNTVVLHAVYRIDDGEIDDALHNGGRLPRLELEPYLFPDLETIQRSMTPDDFPYERPATLGRCYELMTGAEPELIARFLDRAGDERLAGKLRRLEEQAQGADPEQVFYQALMMALGSGPSRSLYYLLAKRAPLAQLRDYAADLGPGDRRLGLEALLLHVAGLAPAPGDLEEAPPEAADYAARLADLWKGFEPYWADRVIATTTRWRRGLRPVNFPYRRLAGIASILARGLDADVPLLESLAARVAAEAPALEAARPARRVHPSVRDLIRAFTVDDPSSFWADHYSFRARPAARRMVLIGEASARSLVFNAVIPSLLLLARRRRDAPLERAARRLFAIYPRLPPNHITEFMGRRLFGEDRRCLDLMTTERRQQGLFQIFYACCNSETGTCDRCYYFED